MRCVTVLERIRTVLRDVNHLHRGSEGLPAGSQTEHHGYTGRIRKACEVFEINRVLLRSYGSFPVTLYDNRDAMLYNKERLLISIL